MTTGLLSMVEEGPRRYNPDATFHHVLLPGAWQPEEVYQPFMETLRTMGHTAVLAAIQGYDPLQSVHDDANAALQAAGDQDQVVVLAHSRQAEVVPYLLERIEAGRVAAVFIINSGGPKSLVLKPEYAGQPSLERYQPGYIEAQITRPDGLIEFKPQLAHQFFYHDMPKSSVAGIIANLHPERPAPLTTPPDLPEDVPKFSIRSRDDPIHNQERGRLTDSQWLHTKPYEIPGGHTPHLSQKELLARLVIRLTRFGR